MSWVWGMGIWGFRPLAFRTGFFSKCGILIGDHRVYRGRTSRFSLRYIVQVFRGHMAFRNSPVLLGVSGVVISRAIFKLNVVYKLRTHHPSFTGP